MERGRRVEKLYDVVQPVLPREATREDSAMVKLDAPARKRFSGILRQQTRRVEAAHPTFSVDPVSGTASMCGSPWPLEHDDAKVGEDAASLVTFWDAYRTAFRGRIEKLQRDYFTFLCWMFFSPFICTLRCQAALEGRDVIRFPRVGIIYGKANSGKTQLVEIAGRFMFGDEFQGAIRSRLTTQHLRAIEASYRRMPAFFDDVGWRRSRDHGRSTWEAQNSVGSRGKSMLRAVCVADVEEPGIPALELRPESLVEHRTTNSNRWMPSQPIASWTTPCSSRNVMESGTRTRRQIIGLIPSSRTLSRTIAPMASAADFTDSMTENCALPRDSIKIDPTEFCASHEAPDPNRSRQLLIERVESGAAWA